MVLFSHLNKSIISCVDWDVCNLVANTLFHLDFSVVCQVLLHILEIPLSSDADSGRLHSAFNEVISYCWTCLVVFPPCHTFEWQRSFLVMWTMAGVGMMTYHMKRNRNMDQVKMKSYLLLVSPHQLSSSSGEADISNEEGDACQLYRLLWPWYLL